MEIQGTRAVVTGGGAGIGRAIALALAERGADVAVVDIEKDAAEAVAAEVEKAGRRGLAIACDVTDGASVEALADRVFSELGGAELLFNNAGVGGGGPLLDAGEADFRWILEVNLVGLWQGCRVFGQRFRDQGARSWIVNTGSEHSLGFPHPGQGFYTASKHAVLGLSDVLRHELPEHVGISVLCPGVVATRFWDSSRNRPERFGGSADGDPFAEAIVNEGMDAAEIGRRAVAGVESEEFLIVTHSQAHRYAKERWQAIDDAFARQAPYDEADERYDIGQVAARVLQRMQS